MASEDTRRGHINALVQSAAARASARRCGSRVNSASEMKAADLILHARSLARARVTVRRSIVGGEIP